nr:MAG TPA: hypothetical protein [Caudoviricetes sp.]
MAVITPHSTHVLIANINIKIKPNSKRIIALKPHKNIGKKANPTIPNNVFIFVTS